MSSFRLLCWLQCLKFKPVEHHLVQNVRPWKMSKDQQTSIPLQHPFSQTYHGCIFNPCWNPSFMASCFLHVIMRRRGHSANAWHMCGCIFTSSGNVFFKRVAGVDRFQIACSCSHKVLQSEEESDERTSLHLSQTSSWDRDTCARPEIQPRS